MAAQRNLTNGHAALCGLAALVVGVLVGAPITSGLGKECAAVLAHIYAGIGIGLLAFPAYHISRYGYFLMLRADANKNQSPDMRRLAEEIRGDIQAHRDSWGMGKACCFVFGSAFSLAGELFALTQSVWS